MVRSRPRRPLPPILALAGALLLAACAGRAPEPPRSVVTEGPPDSAAAPAPPEPTPLWRDTSRALPLPPPDTGAVDPGPLRIVYPRPSLVDTLLAPGDSVVVEPLSDSLFLFGSVEDPRGRLQVNGQAVALHDSGGWLAWVERADTLPLPHDLPLPPQGEPAKGVYHVVTLRYDAPSLERPVLRRLLVATPDPAEPEPGREPIEEIRRQIRVDTAGAVIRCGWPGAYYVFPEPGTPLLATGRTLEGAPYWRVALSATLEGWIEERFVSRRTLPPPDPATASAGIQVVETVVGSVQNRTTRLRIPLDERLPYRVHQPGQGRMTLTLYGAASWLDLIVQPAGSPVVRRVGWEQRDRRTLELQLDLHPGRLWGWETSFDADTALVLELHAPPPRLRLRNLTIALDPGHGGWNWSAIGPTGTVEKRINLELMEVVRTALAEEGAEVVVTREEDRFLELHERIELARDAGADLLISLHHNGLPQGINPHDHHGPTVLYYQPHSLPLARQLQAALTEGPPRWEGDGVRYQNLALTRASFAPAVLLEAGYLLHPGEEQRLSLPEHQEALAARIVAGLERYLERVRPEAQPH